MRALHNCDVQITALCPYCDQPMLIIDEVCVVKNDDDVMCLAHQSCHTADLNDDEVDED